MNKKPSLLVMHSGRIKTDDGWVESIVVQDGVITHVGTDEEILAVFPAGSPAHIDLNNRVVLPGLHDTHVHPVYAGTRERRCKIPQGATLDEVLTIIEEAARNSKPGEWILGGQWDAFALGGVPDRYMLDKVAPLNPVQLEDTSAHSSWANSLALEIAGITADTPDPADGIFERDSNGVPTGVQREAAAYFISGCTPTPNQQEIEEAIQWSLQQMLSFGITSFTEAALGFTAGAAQEMAAYHALVKRDEIKQRTRISVTWDAEDSEALEVIATRNKFSSERVRTDGVKVFLDGVPTDGHTAAMLQPYADTIEGRDDDASRYGMLRIPTKTLNEAVAKFDSEGLTVKFHAAGDAAVRAALDAIEYAQSVNGKGPQMHNVGHCTFVAPEDIRRAAQLGATLEVSPYLWSPAPICSDIAAAVGETVIERVWPIREMLDAGVLVVAGSDWSVVPSVNPWIGIETMITREKPGGSAETFGPSQAVTIEEAIEIFTINAARQEGMADRVGRIAVGMLADIIVVDRNPFEVSNYEIHQVVVEQTIINGEIVFDRSETSGD
jgi:predicted amidohydrolase YtcJ